MKKLFFFQVLIFQFFLSILTPAQWFQQNSNTTTALNSVYFISRDSGIVVGNSGTVLKTTNGGNNWIPISSGMTGNFTDLEMVSKRSGFCICGTEYNNKIFKTTNYGESWSVVLSLQYTSFQAIDFIDSLTGYAVGFDQTSSSNPQITILKTYDSGISWSEVYRENSYLLILDDISFADINNGMAIARYQSRIYKTTDAGTSWITYSTTNNPQLSIYYWNPQYAIIGGIQMQRTTNGGLNWSPVVTPQMSTIEGFCFLDSQYGVAVGFRGLNNNSLIMKTTDAGITWIPEDAIFYPGLKGVYFTDSNHGTAVGLNGTILRTVNYSLPVELASFTAESKQGRIEIIWRTYTEKNNQGFELQRKSGEGEWILQAFIKGAGTSTNMQYYSFTDKPEIPGKYYYRLKQVDFDGSTKYSEEATVDFNYATEFRLYQNYPNPFNSSTTIRYSIDFRTKVIIDIFDVLGNRIETILDQEKTPGVYELSWNPENLPSGVYYCMIKAGEYIKSNKMVMVK
jgi:photosystem II stability/assembly factor-like uncharacterized protein